MAIYKLQPMIPQPLGSLGGTTFQRIGKSFAIRKRNKPVDKQTIKQFEKRQVFASVSTNWRELSGAEQTSFIDEAPNYPRVNSLGNPYTITGDNLQQSSNVSLEIAALPQITTMPAAPMFPAFSISIFSLNIAGSALAFQLNPLIVPAGFNCNVHMSHATELQGATAQYKLIDSIPELTNTPTLNFFTQYVNVYGAVGNLAGKRFNCRVELIHIATGQLSASEFRNGAIV